MVIKYENFINESNSDYINFNTTNLEQDFKMLNTKLFANKLDIVPLKWYKNKSKLGEMVFNVIQGVDANGKKYTKEEILGVKISTFYKLTRQQYLDVLAHEMIHVCISQQGIKDNDAHGRRFTAMKDDINRRFPEFNIKQSENANDYAVSTPDTKIPELGVLLFEMNENEYSIIVVAETIIEDRVLLDKFAEDFKKIIPKYFPRERSINLTAYKCRIPSLTTYKVKRVLNFSSLSMYEVSDSLLQQIQASSKIIDKRLK